MRNQRRMVYQGPKRKEGDDAPEKIGLSFCLCVLFAVLILYSGCGGGGGGGGAAGGVLPNSPSPSPTGSTAPITGTVTKAADSQPLANATVNVNSQNYTTNGSGQFTTAALSTSTTYDVTCTAAGYNGQSKSGAGGATVNFSVTATGGSSWTINGQITDVQSNGVPGAAVSCGGINANADINGNYTLSNVPEGSQNLAATQTDMQNYNESVTVSSNLTRNFQMTIKTLTFSLGWSAGLATDVYNLAYRSNTIYAPSASANTCYTFTTSGGTGSFAIANPSLGAGFDTNGNFFVTYPGTTQVALHSPPGTQQGPPWPVTVSNSPRDVDGNGLNNKAIVVHDNNGSGLGFTEVTKSGGVTALGTPETTKYIPKSIAVYQPNNRVYVACTINYGIRVYNLDTGTNLTSYLTNRYCNSVDVKGNRLAIHNSDGMNSFAEVYYIGSGSFIQMTTFPTSAILPTGIVFDDNYNIYVGDQHSSRRGIYQYVRQ